jgi:hypothetical protein
MKTKSKSELIAMAVDVFENYPDQDTCFAREDGNIFFSENHSELGKGELKVYIFERSELAKQPKNQTPKVETPKTAEPAKADSEPAKTEQAFNGKVVDMPKAETTNGKTGNVPNKNDKPK